MKKRKSIPQRIRALLQQEIHSKCPFCESVEVDTFEVHHLNEIPDDNNPDNLLMLCPTCHSKINVGTIPRNDVYQKKYDLKNVKEKQSTSQGPQSNYNACNVLNAGRDINIIYKNPSTKAPTPTSGVIGTSTYERAYIQYLYNRLFDYKKATPNYDDARAGTTIARYVRKLFGTTWTHVPIERFESLAELLKTKIDETPIGRKHRKNGIKSYSSFEEFKNKSILDHEGLK